MNYFSEDENVFEICSKEKRHMFSPLNRSINQNGVDRTKKARGDFEDCLNDVIYAANQSRLSILLIAIRQMIVI